MPMIDVYAAEGTFASKHDLAQQLAAAVMRWEQVPPIPLFENNTAAFVHDLAGPGRHPRQQDLGPDHRIPRRRMGHQRARQHRRRYRRGGPPRTSQQPEGTTVMTTLPSIVLVHGAWADGSSWSSVIERLQADG